MTVLTSDRDVGEVALETHVRELFAAGYSEDAVAGALSRADPCADRDALWLYSWVIGGHRRAGLRPRAELSSLD
ncbi:MAG: hypothetical protein QOJ12_42 [Thermoleophilales bacterium]|jgi:hypothetical protein|nr:hypothetical protein [Thermoleophilales bacterium]